MAVGLSVVTLLVFGRVVNANFVQWDDDIEVYQNPHLKGLDAATLRWAVTDVSYVWRYQPVTWVTWAAIREVCGLRPFAYHLANLICHLLNSVLVFLILRKLLFLDGTAEADPARRNWTLGCAGLGALLWAVHPLREASTGQ